MLLLPVVCVLRRGRRVANTLRKFPRNGQNSFANKLLTRVNTRHCFNTKVFFGSFVFFLGGGYVESNAVLIIFLNRCCTFEGKTFHFLLVMKSSDQVGLSPVTRTTDLSDLEILVPALFSVVDTTDRLWHDHCIGVGCHILRFTVESPTDVQFFSLQDMHNRV